MRYRPPASPESRRAVRWRAGLLETASAPIQGELLGFMLLISFFVKDIYSCIARFRLKFNDGEENASRGGIEIMLG